MFLDLYRWQELSIVNEKIRTIYFDYINLCATKIVTDLLTFSAVVVLLGSSGVCEPFLGYLVVLGITLPFSYFNSMLAQASAHPFSAALKNHFLGLW